MLDEVKREKIMAKIETERSYPVRCVECGKREVRPAVVSQEIQKNHDGRVYDLKIKQLPVIRCESCGEIYFTNASDDAITAALRDELGLLSPVQILRNIESLNMQQKRLAECLGIAPETLSRWVNGSMIQSRAMDNLLRAYFGSAEVRANLIGEDGNRRFGKSVSLRAG